MLCCKPFFVTELPSLCVRHLYKGTSVTSSKSLCLNDRSIIVTMYFMNILNSSEWF